MSRHSDLVPVREYVGVVLLHLQAGVPLPADNDRLVTDMPRRVEEALEELREELRDVWSLPDGGDL